MRTPCPPIRGARLKRHTARAAAMIVVFGTGLAPALAEQATTRTRPAASQPPPKDCTRFNGRFGYYGNPWCTPAEQDRWDRWEARRFKPR